MEIVITAQQIIDLIQMFLILLSYIAIIIVAIKKIK